MLIARTFAFISVAAVDSARAGHMSAYSHNSAHNHNSAYRDHIQPNMSTSGNEKISPVSILDGMMEYKTNTTVVASLIDESWTYQAADSQQPSAKHTFSSHHIIIDDLLPQSP